MTSLTDDPTSYLTRDADTPMVILAGSVDTATTVAKQYGVAIQVNGPDVTKGVRVVTNESEANAVVASLPNTTLWAGIPDGKWTMNTYLILYKGFGPPKRMDQAMGVITKGIAWRADKMMVL